MEIYKWETESGKRDDYGWGMGMAVNFVLILGCYGNEKKRGSMVVDEVEGRVIMAEELWTSGSEEMRRRKEEMGFGSSENRVGSYAGIG